MGILCPDFAGIAQNGHKVQAEPWLVEVITRGLPVRGHFGPANKTFQRIKKVMLDHARPSESAFEFAFGGMPMKRSATSPSLKSIRVGML